MKEQLKQAMAIARNPYGFDQDTIRSAVLTVCDALEESLKAQDQEPVAVVSEHPNRVAELIELAERFERFESIGYEARMATKDASVKGEK